MLAERMNVYQANTGKTPQRIIIFRNGVSEVGKIILTTCAYFTYSFNRENSRRFMERSSLESNRPSTLWDTIPKSPLCCVTKVIRFARLSKTATTVITAGTRLRGLSLIRTSCQSSSTTSIYRLTPAPKARLNPRTIR